MWSYLAEGGNVRAEPFLNPLRFHADLHQPRPVGLGRSLNYIDSLRKLNSFAQFCTVLHSVTYQHFPTRPGASE